MRYEIACASEAEANRLAGMPELIANGHRVRVETRSYVIVNDSGLDVFRQLDEDSDGHYDGTFVWIGGTERGNPF